MHLQHIYAWTAMHAPIHLRTLADLLARGHTLQLYCLHCDRWRTASLEQLARRGLGDRPIATLHFRCALCGARAQRQLRPPELAPATGTGWMQMAIPASAPAQITRTSSTAEPDVLRREPLQRRRATQEQQRSL